MCCIDRLKPQPKAELELRWSEDTHGYFLPNDGYPAPANSRAYLRRPPPLRAPADWR
jgi:hypothetical protein